jgi:hypothetical protein
VYILANVVSNYGERHRREGRSEILYESRASSLDWLVLSTPPRVKLPSAQETHGRVHATTRVRTHSSLDPGQVLSSRYHFRKENTEGPAGSEIMVPRALLLVGVTE